MKASRRNLRAAWANRPRAFWAPTWALILAVDRLPWPWGEEIVTRILTLGALAQPRLRRRALAWAAAQGRSGRARWRLAVGVFAARSRFVARAGLTGIVDLSALRATVSLRGAEHLPAAPRGVILLGFHVGPVSPDIALRIAGFRVSWIVRGGVWGVRGILAEYVRRFPEQCDQLALGPYGRSAPRS